MALIPKKIRYGGQPLRAWEIAVRLREQAARFRVECDIGETFPQIEAPTRSA